MPWVRFLFLHYAKYEAHLIDKKKRKGVRERCQCLRSRAKPLTLTK